MLISLTSIEVKASRRTVAQPRFSFKIRLLEGILKVGRDQIGSPETVAQANPNSDGAAPLAIRTGECRRFHQLS